MESLDNIIETIKTNKKTSIATVLTGILAGAAVYYTTPDNPYEGFLDPILYVGASIAWGVSAAFIPLTISLIYQFKKSERK